MSARLVTSATCAPPHRLRDSLCFLSIPPTRLAFGGTSRTRVAHPVHAQHVTARRGGRLGGECARPSQDDTRSYASSDPLRWCLHHRAALHVRRGARRAPDGIKTERDGEVRPVLPRPSYHCRSLFAHPALLLSRPTALHHDVRTYHRFPPGCSRCHLCRRVYRPALGLWLSWRVQHRPSAVLRLDL